MECLAHKKFQIPSTCVVHTDTASGSPEHLQLIVLLEHTRTWYWPSSEGAPGSTQHFVEVQVVVQVQIVQVVRTEGAPLTWKHPTN